MKEVLDKAAELVRQGWAQDAWVLHTRPMIGFPGTKRCALAAVRVVLGGDPFTAPRRRTAERRLYRQAMKRMVKHPGVALTRPALFATRQQCIVGFNDHYSTKKSDVLAMMGQ